MSTSSSSDACNSRSLSWLVNSCIPKNTSDLHFQTPTRHAPQSEPEASTISISSLPDDLLLSCLVRAPLSSLPSLAAVNRRFLHLLSSPPFFSLRRSLSPLSPTLLSLYLPSPDLLTIALNPLTSLSPRITTCRLPSPISNPAFVSVENLVFIIGRGSAARLDTWTGRVTQIPPPHFPRKKFAAAAVDGKIYVAGGSSRTSALEIYDPLTSRWRIAAAEAPTRRYGCAGAAAGGVFYMAGGLRVDPLAAAAHAATAGTVEAYHVRGSAWARGISRAAAAVPGGGCIVGACGVGPSLYVVASNAVEFTFWRWEGGGSKRRGEEWAQLEPPPVQGRLSLGFSGAVRFSCCAVGEGRMVAAVHVRARGQNENGHSFEGAMLVYDVGSGEWSRGQGLPVVGFRRAGLVCVQC